MAILHETILSLPDIEIKGVFSIPVTGVSIDTRTLNAGELFVAFNGAQVDGHDFIPKAISRGASAVMASTSWDGIQTWEAPIPLILSSDPVKTLADLARAHRQRFDIPVIAVTGTNGKTSTKNLLARLLEQRYSVLKTEGNLNNHIGLPLTILNLDDSHEAAVIEMGASRSGDIHYLCDIAQPTQGLITNIGLAHTEFFHDLQTIQQTKAELFRYLKKHHGRAFVNIDDPLVRKLGRTCNNPIRFACHTSADMTFALNGPDSTGRYDLQFGDYTAHLQQPGRVTGLNAAAAVTVALHNGLRYDQVKTVLENDPGEPGRMQHIQVNGVEFFNDAYNANPASTRAGLQTIQALHTEGRKLLIFADMLELGSLSTSLHREIATDILAAGFDAIILLGREVAATATALQAAGHPHTFLTADSTEAIRHFTNQVHPGDLVYLKGSRGMHLETFITSYKELI